MTWTKNCLILVDLLKKKDYSTSITDTEGEIPSILV